MIRVKAIILLLIFSLSLLKPFTPYLEYYLNYDYITEVLCINKNEPITVCDGKCFLADQLSAEFADEYNSPEPAPSQKWEKTITFLTTGSISIDAARFMKKTSYGSFYMESDLLIFNEIPTPPPRS